MKRYASDINIFEDNIQPKPLQGEDLLPIKTIDNRFQTDILINGKTNFEKDNNIINSMTDEIISLKEKLSFVYEKDSEIQELKCSLETLKKQNQELQDSTGELNKLKIENKSLRDQLDSLQVERMELDSLKNENKLLKQKMDEYYKQLHPDDEDEIEDIIREPHYEITTKKPVEEMIDINVNHLKFVLYRRLKVYHENHIDEIIKSHNLRKKSKIPKSTMESILQEAIHI